MFIAAIVNFLESSLVTQIYSIMYMSLKLILLMHSSSSRLSLLMSLLLVLRLSSASEFLIKGLERWDIHFVWKAFTLHRKAWITNLRNEPHWNYKKSWTYLSWAISLSFVCVVKQVEVQYLHDYAGISTSVGLTANPIVNFSGVVGTDVLALGTDVSYDTKIGELTKFNAGLNFTKVDLVASLTV